MPTVVLQKLRNDFTPFCRKYGIRSLAVFGSLARGTAHPNSDLDLLVDPAQETTIPEILEMAGEAEEIAGRPVDFVLRESLLKTSDRKRADHILSTAVFLYGHAPVVNDGKSRLGRLRAFKNRRQHVEAFFGKRVGQDW